MHCCSEITKVTYVTEKKFLDWSFFRDSSKDTHFFGFSAGVRDDTDPKQTIGTTQRIAAR